MKKPNHGMGKTRTYHVWGGMIQRCTNPNNPGFRNYGGRGITVSEEWRDFLCFLRDMGECPDNHELDRRDNNKGYSMENCRWVSHSVNNRNKRDNKLVTFQGVTRTVTEWCEVTGMHRNTLDNRLKRGWPIDQAMTRPVKRKTRRADKQ